MYKKFGKRAIDILCSIVGLLVLSPVIVIVSILLFIANDGQPFFYQLRPGKNGKIFKIVKFRTMNNRKDRLGNLLPDHVRLTKIGSVVRKASIDEIPQLFNVLLGQMSLVGPRPLLVEYLPHYSPFQNRRHEVRPGITGWAQVNGRNTISWKQKFELDVWYVDNVSFAVDMKIMFNTILKVLAFAEISVDGHVSMPNFLEANEENK